MDIFRTKRKQYIEDGMKPVVALVFLLCALLANTDRVSAQLPGGNTPQADIKSQCTQRLQVVCRA
jgi:hypothetical protein